MALIPSLSEVLGYTSIGCWLGAQFPQVLENHRRRSVDGLAWPFLANWLLGDMSNLVGCILTHQLPFQTYLATYFCFVDLSLVGQYIYYRESVKPTPPYGNRSRTTSTATLTRRVSLDHPPTHYRALSHVAANVAAAAAFAAQQEEQARWRPPAHHSVDSHVGDSEADDEVDEEALARLADSFHSERGTHKKVSWERRTRGGSLGRTHPPLMSPVTRDQPSFPLPTSPVLNSDQPDYLNRGRRLSREMPLDEAEAEWAAESSRHRRSSRASKKNAAMVFLGAWALFGVGTLASSKRGVAAENRIRVGRVLDDAKLTSIPSAYVPQQPPPTHLPNVPPTSFEDLQFLDDTHPPHDDEPGEHHEGPSTEYIIGRISAWTCTTLYLTSRLPQIWKNYARKSVEGLSMSLFIFAFLGNFFYVASILTSPNMSAPEPKASAFLRESIPYLLGSGGTLMFDVTIVTQSFLYRPKAGIRGRRISRTMAEEEEGLLSAGATGAEDPSTPSRRRMPSSAENLDS